MSMPMVSESESFCNWIFLLLLKIFYRNQGRKPGRVQGMITRTTMW